jgi:hypothetical protein
MYSAKFCNGGLHQINQVFIFQHIATNGNSFYAQLPDFTGCLFSIFRLKISYDNIGASPGQKYCGSLAYPVSTTGNDSGFSCQIK